MSRERKSEEKLKVQRRMQKLFCFLTPHCKMAIGKCGQSVPTILCPKLSCIHHGLIWSEYCGPGVENLKKWLLRMGLLVLDLEELKTQIELNDEEIDS